MVIKMHETRAAQRRTWPLRSLDWLPISIRARESLCAAGVTYVGQLVQLGPKSLLAIPNFSSRSLEIVEEALESEGLALGMTLPSGVRRTLRRRLRT